MPVTDALPATPPLVWGLFDDRPGNAGQVQGVLEHLGFPYLPKRFTYSWAATLPNGMRGWSLTGVDASRSDLIEAPWPDIVVSAGRRIAPVALYIKKRHPSTLLVHIMDPGVSRASFDLVVLPEHDGRAASDTILLTRGSLHALTQAKLGAARESWHLTFEQLPSPRIAVMVGALSVREAEGLIERLHARVPQASILVTTSRRTPDAVVKALQNSLAPMQHYFYAYGAPGQNPYMALLAWADVVVVTGDSISMLSEACSTGKPVYVFPTQKTMGKKHHGFVAGLVRDGYLRKPEQFSLDWSGGDAFNEAARVARHIQAAYGKKSGD